MEDKYSVLGTENGFQRVIGEGMTFKEAVKLVNQTNDYFTDIKISLDYELRNPSGNILVFSDCEMRLYEVRKLLAERTEDLREQFIFLGNYLSKDKGFIPFMNYLVKLRDGGKDIVFVRGVNEHNLHQKINHLDNFIGDSIYRKEMFDSIEEQLGFKLEELFYRNIDYFNLINSSYSYFENDEYIFTSGGLDLSGYWRESLPEHLHKTTDEFIKSKNYTGKTIVFGDKPVEELNNSAFKKPWINKDHKKIGINGRVRQRGRLIGLSVLDGEEYFIGIRHKDTRIKTYAYNIYSL